MAGENLLVGIFEEDDELSEILAIALEDNGYRTRRLSAQHFSENALPGTFDEPELILYDIRYPDENSWKRFQETKENYDPNTHVFLPTTASPKALSDLTGLKPMEDFLPQPFELDDFYKIFDKKHPLRRQVSEAPVKSIFNTS